MGFFVIQPIFFIILIDFPPERCYNVPMEKTRFLPEGEYTKIFLGREEKELRLASVGYNDFRSVKPQYFMRTQTQYTVHFVLDGKGTLNVESKSFSVRRHQVFLLDNRCRFSYFPDGEDPWEYVWFDFYGDLAPAYAGQCGFSADSPLADCALPQRLTAELHALFSRLREQRSVPYFEFLSAFFLLMSSVSREKDETVFFYHENYIEEIERFIELHYLSRDFSVEGLARSMHISHSHLCRIFKKSEGVSVVSYIVGLRLRRAAELLKKTGYTAREIADMSGFGEYEYFLKAFKRRFGVTTGEYREKCRADAADGGHSN